MLNKKIFFLLLPLLVLSGCNSDDDEGSSALQLNDVFAGSTRLSTTGVTANVPVDQTISLIFSAPVDKASAQTAITLLRSGQEEDVDLQFSSGDKNVLLFPATSLRSSTSYTLQISGELRGADGGTFAPVSLNFSTALGNLALASGNISGSNVTQAERMENIPRSPIITLEFSQPLDASTLDDGVVLSGPGGATLQYALSNENKTLTVTVAAPLRHITRYSLDITTGLKGVNGETFATTFSKNFYTVLDETPKFPVVSDEALLTLVQQQTFKYFWDFAHPASGMARERNTSGDIVTSGGSGFGIMALVVGMERAFITRTDGVQRLDKIVTFLEDADRFHGAWSHWINGATGAVVPFSQRDDGGDLVETSFLVQGLLTARQYLAPTDTVGNNLINRITELWEEVEWDWYRKNNEEVLYWHWSPTYEWQMNFALSGYFEQQITYILAAASPTHGIPKSVYTNGYGQNGGIVKNNTYYGIKLPLGTPAPLFWVHYSYLGFDPHLSDDYANYWEQNTNATLINHAYCVDNPKNFVGYSDACWGLTSSDNHRGYDAHSPVNDLGVITPTAALSSFPYTPEESMKALKFFYYTLGDRLWGPYGFYDAFNLTEQWTASSYLAIDQGPIIVMIENHRTGLLWELFMSAPEVQAAKTKLGLH